MTETIEAVMRRVVAAMANARPDDVIEGVKTAVADSLRQADPTAKVNFTNYFNHTYNPDMTVSWPKGESGERPIFLRSSLRSAVQSEDLPALSDRTPIVIGLKPEKRRVLDDLRPRIKETGGSLAAELSAVVALAAVQDGASHAKSASLSALVRSNVLQQGQGFLDTRGAARIADVDRQSGAGGARALRETVEELFTGAAGSRLSETASLLSDVFDKGRAEEVASRLADRPLTDSELGVVLPRVLTVDPGQVDPRVWRALGASITLPQLELLAGVLVDHDLTPLIAPSAGLIDGFRAQLDMNANLVAEEEGVPVADIARWRMRGSLLAAEMGNRILFIVSDRRKLKVPGEGVDARLDELDAHLDGLELTSVALHGLSDQFEVGSVEPGRVRTNVDRLREAIQDDFHVPQVQVRERDAQLDGIVKVEFGSMRAERVSGAASLRAFVLAAPMLSRSDPIPARLINGVLGRSSSANDDAERNSDGDSDVSGNSINGETLS